MTDNYYNIKVYNKVINGNLFKNNELYFNLPNSSFEQFADEVYKYFQLNYPKFHKMDHLSKLGFLSSELLLKDLPLKELYDPYKIGVVLSNKSSSLDTDIKYYNAVKRGIPSPAVFVYTLPNIMIGEICIRNRIKGENTFSVSDKYDIKSQVNYVSTLFESSIVDACICGWVELIEESYESFLYLVTRENSTDLMKYSFENIEKLYNE